MKCIQCGSENTADAKFCRGCGNNLEEQRRVALEEEKRLAQERKEQQERLAEARRKQIELWRNRTWGNKAFVRGLTAAILLSLVVGGGYWYYQKQETAKVIAAEKQREEEARVRAEAQAKAKAEAQRVTERSLWLNGDTSCSQNVDCLVADMRKSGATPNAIDLAERLSAARNGALAWAIELHKYGPVDLVTYDCTVCRSGGFALVNGVPNILADPSIDGNSLRTFAAYMSTHPNAFLLRGIGFVEHKVLDGRGQRFIFANWVGDCEACAPTAILEYAFDFDNTGRQIGTQVVGLFALSDVHVAFSPPGK